jgi:NAD(P)-dependent dehydrogenase (short-subunit alcohol dehydrogenase family)
MELEAKTAIVTGAARGIGRYFALALAEAGAAVVVAGRDTEPGSSAESIEATAEEIKRSGGTALAVHADPAIPDDMKRLVGRAVFEFGGIDILVNNAATREMSPFLDLTPIEFDRAFEVNVRGPLFACQAAIPHMIAQGGGSLINITAGVSKENLAPHQCLYGISKAALDRLVVFLADEGRPHDIAVNALNPGPIATEQVQAILDDPDSPVSKLGVDWVAPSVDYLGPPLVHLARQRGNGITGQRLELAEFGDTWPRN